MLLRRERPNGDALPQQAFGQPVGIRVRAMDADQEEVRYARIDIEARQL
jgi:hypothetical protein